LSLGLVIFDYLVQPSNWLEEGFLHQSSCWLGMIEYCLRIGV